MAIRLVTIAMHQMLFPVRMSLATSSRGGANTVISDCCDDDTLSRARLGHRTRTSNISNDIAVCHITVHHINVHIVSRIHIQCLHHHTDRYNRNNPLLNAEYCIEFQTIMWL